MAEEPKTPETEPAENQQKPYAKAYSEQEYNAVAEQLQNANETIWSYKDMDIDGIKASVEDYKQKWEQSENDCKAFEHRIKVRGFVNSFGLKDDIYKKYVTDIAGQPHEKFTKICYN